MLKRLRHYFNANWEAIIETILIIGLFIIGGCRLVMVGYLYSLILVNIHLASTAWFLRGVRTFSPTRTWYHDLLLTFVVAIIPINFITDPDGFFPLNEI